MPTRLFLQQTVLDAARARLAWVFDEFDTLYVAVSGGKDSTAILQLALQEAERRGRVPLPAFFIDQEGEWAATVDYLRGVRADPRVQLLWLQIPILMNNATSIDRPWLHCWAPGEAWMRAREPGALTENVYGTSLFKELPGAFLQTRHPGAPAAVLNGLRAQESPARAMGLTTWEAYKGVTWGRRFSATHFQFSPLYDWSYTDVWRAIATGGETGTPWPYNAIYDRMWQSGETVANMRVSNVHHEHATRHLYRLQELEPATWDALVRRMPGIHAVGTLQADFYAPQTLPRAFPTWTAYRDYLLQHLSDAQGRAAFAPAFAKTDALYADDTPALRVRLAQVQIHSILKNDWEEGTMLEAFTLAHPSARAKAAMAVRRAARRVSPEVR